MRQKDFQKYAMEIRNEIEELSVKEILTKAEISYLVTTAYNFVDEAYRKSKIIEEIIECYPLPKNDEEILDEIKRITFTEA